MPEMLPGNPTEAGPDSHDDQPEPDWNDLLHFSKEETQFALHRYGVRTKEDRRHLLEGIARSRAFLDSAEMLIKDMDLIRGCIANTEADLADGKYDNWQPKPKPALGAIRG